MFGNYAQNDDSDNSFFDNEEEDNLNIGVSIEDFDEPKIKL